MTQEKEPSRESQAEDEAQLYGEMAENLGSRAVEIEEVDVGEQKSLSAKEEDYSDLSDLQGTLKRLYPNLGNKISNAIMFARVSPDMFLAMIRLLTNAEVRRADPHEEINISEIAAKYYILSSIGLDGKGRIDSIELAGSARENAELENISKNLGF